MKRGYIKRTRFERKGTFKRGYSWGLKRSRLRVRKYSKKPAEAGASLRELKDEMDGLVRTIIAARDRKCVNFGCRETEGLHVGHYIKRGVLALRWDLRNCNAQCDLHNEAHNIDPESYRDVMCFRYGAATTMDIDVLGEQNPRLTYVELVAIRDGLKAARDRVERKVAA